MVWPLRTRSRCCVVAHGVRAGCWVTRGCVCPGDVRVFCTMSGALAGCSASLQLRPSPGFRRHRAMEPSAGRPRFRAGVWTGLQNPAEPPSFGAWRIRRIRVALGPPAGAALRLLPSPSHPGVWLGVPAGCLPAGLLAGLLAGSAAGTPGPPARSPAPPGPALSWLPRWGSARTAPSTPPHFSVNHFLSGGGALGPVVVLVLFCPEGAW